MPWLGCGCFRVASSSRMEHLHEKPLDTRQEHPVMFLVSFPQTASPTVPS